jgi:AAA family ATPase
VPPPDAASRDAILRIEIAKMPTSEAIDFVQLVELSAGFSGAEVVALCQDAALAAIEKRQTALTTEDLIQATNRVKPQISAEMLSYYENFRA